MGKTAQRVMLATVREELTSTELLQDELPPLQENEIRLQVDKVGLSSNNLFYLQMGEAPFLKFFSVYPLPETYKHLAIMPAWGVATVIETENADFKVGERFRGFLHMTNVVQMKARRTPEGFTAYGDKRGKLNQAYNGFLEVKATGASPIAGTGEKADLAMTAAPGALSGFILSELLQMHDFYGGNRIVLTSASSKLSLATALLLQDARSSGALNEVIGYTSAHNKPFVEQTGLYDRVLDFDEDLAQDHDARHVLVDVAGDAAVFKRNKTNIVKALAVGGTHANADASTFTAFGPSGFVKMFIDMMGPQWLKSWASRGLDPRLEMFFAPTVITELLARWGQYEMERKSDDALQRFVDAAIDGDWITVQRFEDITSIQQAYANIVSGMVPPSNAVVVSLPT